MVSRMLKDFREQSSEKSKIFLLAKCSVCLGILQISTIKAV